MKWNEFFQAVKDGSLAPVYLFSGPEEYTKAEALRRLREKLLPLGLEALNDLTLEDVTAQQITDAAATLPVMCERRIVTVMDWAPLMPGKAKNEQAEVDWMEKWLEDPPDSCVTIFYLRAKPDDGKKRKKDAKKMAALLAKKAVTVEFDCLNASELAKWSAARLKPQGKKIGAKALGTLTFMAGQELTRLSGELDKLAAYVGPDQAEITEADVRAIVAPSLEFDIYELLNHLLDRDMLKAQQTVNRLTQTGSNAVSLLSSLTWQLRRLLHMRAGLDAGEPLTVIQRRLGMGEWQAKMTARQCARLDAGWLEALYAACGEYDFAVKSGRMRDQDALNAMMFRIGLEKRRA